MPFTFVNCLVTMKNISRIIILCSAVVLTANASAASFDCAKALGTYEKAICSNNELSELDDELSIAYKIAVVANPDIKISQREWNKLARQCGLDLLSTDKCIKTTYKSRITFLASVNTPSNFPSQSTQGVPVTAAGNVAKNDTVIKGAPVTLNNQIQVIAPKPVTPAPVEVGVARTPASSIVKVVDTSSKSFFNLKGYYLGMTRAEVKKIMPNARFEMVDTVEGKELSGYNCGVAAKKLPEDCNFTFAGEEITGITVAFWGERAYEIQMYFGAYRKKDHGKATFKTDERMATAIDTKYFNESNKGNSQKAGSQWESGDEMLKTEYIEDTNFVSNSLSLNDYKYFRLLQLAGQKQAEIKQKGDKVKNDKKVLSDM